MPSLSIVFAPRFSWWWTLKSQKNLFWYVVFCYESFFTNHGAVNQYNMHYWTVETPHWLNKLEHQRPRMCGIIGDKHWRSFERSTVPKDFGKSTGYISRWPDLEMSESMLFQHDGCPVHNSGASCEVINSDFNGLWTSCN